MPMHKVIKFLFKPLYVLFAFQVPHFFNRLPLKLFKVKFGRNVIINGRLFIRNNGRITLGDNVKINSSIAAATGGGPYISALVTSQNASLSIGNNVGMSCATIIARTSITIEDNVMIGSGACVFDTDFHSLNLENRMKRPDPDIKAKPVKICNGAFIGARSLVLKGVTIGERSIVGAGSVVTKSIPDGEIWAGNPAKFIKKI